MFLGNRKCKIPADVQAWFERLRRVPYLLKQDIPLMPVCNPSGYRACIKAMKGIVKLQAGLHIDIIRVITRKDTGAPWFEVKLVGSALTGFVNGKLIEGRVLEDATD